MFYKKRNAVTRYEHFLKCKKGEKTDQNSGKALNPKIGSRERSKINTDKY